MARVQLLVDAAGNRRRLGEALADAHEVIAPAPGPATELADGVDLCLVDAGGFRTCRQALAEQKRREEPVFLPYLLLTGESPGAIPERVWTAVDEVIETPVDPAVLRNRMECLLRRRELTADLERRRETSRRRFRTLFDAVPDPIVVVGDDGVVTAVNDAFERTFGVERRAVVDERVDGLAGGAGGALADLLDPVLAEQKRRTIELDPGDGETYLTEVNVATVEAAGGTGERIAVFRDVTDRERRRRELEGEVEQLERFASIVSHDLRDPLNTAQAKLRLLRRERDDEDGRLAELAAVHDRMETLIEDVLALARQGRAIGTTEPTPLATVVERAWETIDAPEPATLSRDGDLATVPADGERLQALLENLFGNAVTHAGTDVTVTVGMLPDRPGFFVADDGPGVPRGEREQVFEYGHTTYEDGTGLGLAIVESVAEAHGWTVAVGDAETGGARFEVRFDPDG